MHIDEFDYELPLTSIAQVPATPRDSSRMLVDLGAGDLVVAHDDGAGGDATNGGAVRDVGGALAHYRTADFPSFVGPGDVIVLNDTKVLPGRVRFRRETGGAAEILLLEPRTEGWWEALVRPSRKLPSGSHVVLGDDLRFELGDDLGHGRRLVRPVSVDLLASLARHGEMPLPPYITTPLGDPDRYQTVYADRPASAAAPTAGLHLTPGALATCEARGARVVRVELVVGLDTFRPIAVDNVAEHQMHTEFYRVPDSTWTAVQGARRVIAVGTTSVRALESAATRGELEGRTDLFIRRPYSFAVVDVMLTNFHMPKSSLLVLIDAFVGPRWRDLYREAIHEGYRMLSFGDAMLIARR